MLYIVGVHYKYVHMREIMLQGNIITTPYTRAGFYDFAQNIVYAGYDVYSTKNKKSMTFKPLELLRYMAQGHKIGNAYLGNAVCIEKAAALTAENKEDIVRFREELGLTIPIRDFATCSLGEVIDGESDKASEHIGILKADKRICHTVHSIPFSQYSRFLYSGEKREARLLHKGIVITGKNESTGAYSYVTWYEDSGCYEEREATFTELQILVEQGYTIGNGEIITDTSPRLLLEAELNEQFGDDTKIQARLAASTLMAQQGPWELSYDEVSNDLCLTGVNWEEVKDEVLLIPEGVTSIATEVFVGDHANISLIFPTTLRVIGENAFDSSHYADVIFRSVFDIRSRAFFMAHFKSLKLGFGLQYVGRNAFEMMKLDDEYVELPRTLTAVELQAFVGAKMQLNYPVDGLLYAGECAHMCCTTITRIPQSLLYAGYSSFRSCAVETDAFDVTKGTTMVNAGAFTLEESWRTGLTVDSIKVLKDAQSGLTKLMRGHGV